MRRESFLISRGLKFWAHLSTSIQNVGLAFTVPDEYVRISFL